MKLGSWDVASFFFTEHDRDMSVGRNSYLDELPAFFVFFDHMPDHGNFVFLHIAETLPLDDLHTVTHGAPLPVDLHLDVDILFGLERWDLEYDFSHFLYLLV